jgi:hypothetical protein
LRRRTIDLAAAFLPWIIHQIVAQKGRNLGAIEVHVGRDFSSGLVLRATAWRSHAGQLAADHQHASQNAGGARDVRAGLAVSMAPNRHEADLSVGGSSIGARAVALQDVASAPAVLVDFAKGELCERDGLFRQRWARGDRRAASCQLLVEGQNREVDALRCVQRRIVFRVSPSCDSLLQSAKPLVFQREVDVRMGGIEP